MFCFGRKAERQQSTDTIIGPSVKSPPDDAISELSSDGKYEVELPPSALTITDLKFIDSEHHDNPDEEDEEEHSTSSCADPGDVFLAEGTSLPPPILSVLNSSPVEAQRADGITAFSSVSSEEDGSSPRTLDGGISMASTVDIGRLMSTTSSRHSTSADSTSNSTPDITNLVPEGSPTHGKSPAPGPRYKLLQEGDIQVCRLNHTRTVISKILSSKFLRRWENHHLYLSEHCIHSKTPFGFLETPLMYSSMEDIYSVIRWESNYKYCLRIVLPDGSFLLQAKNSYTRDHWYHSIVWKKNMYNYEKILYNTEDYGVLMKELKSMVDFVMVTPLQDGHVTNDPLKIITTLLTEKKWPDEGESILEIAGPLLVTSYLPAPLAKVLSNMCSTKLLSSRLRDTFHHVARHILKHNVDFGKAPHLRNFLQSYISALNQLPDGLDVVRAWVGAVHGPGFNCPHPRVLPNLAAACLAAFHSIYPTSEEESEELLPVITSNMDDDFPIQDHLSLATFAETTSNDNEAAADLAISDNELDADDNVSPVLLSPEKKQELYCDSSTNKEESDEDDSPENADMICFSNILLYMSSYTDWAEGLGAVLQPVPIPHNILKFKHVASAFALTAFKLGTDRRCAVHRFVLPLRQGRPGWLQILCPSRNNLDPERVQQWGDILDTLLNCCCKRKCFLIEMAKMLPACLLLALRAHPAGLSSLCLMLEWEILDSEQSKIEAVQALRSTPLGKRALYASCQRQVHLKKLQQKGGPRRLTLPSCATDADVSRLLSAGSFGNLECLSLAFTHVTSAVAEELIKLPSLRYLNLWATQFGDAGVLLIVEHLHRLQVLNLCETPVSDVGISALSALPNLKKLNLNSTRLSAATWARLQPMLPALQESDIRYTDAW